MTIPIRCSGVRMGGPEHDYRDIQCPEPATTEFDGKPVCEGHRERWDASERERICETFTDGVPLDRIRAIQEAGGLAKLLEAFDQLQCYASWAVNDFRVMATKAAEIEKEARETLEAVEPFADRED